MLHDMAVKNSPNIFLSYKQRLNKANYANERPGYELWFSIFRSDGSTNGATAKTSTSNKSKFRLSIEYKSRECEIQWREKWLTVARQTPSALPFALMTKKKVQLQKAQRVPGIRDVKTIFFQKKYFFWRKLSFLNLEYIWNSFAFLFYLKLGRSKHIISEFLCKCHI